MSAGFTQPPAFLRAPDGALAGLAPPSPTLDGLLTRVRAYDPHADTALIEAAFETAAFAHNGQTRDNGEPYITHPLAVADFLAGLRLDTSSIVTALLHDTVEDTKLTLDQIGRRFGPEVASLVDGVTKLGRLELESARTKQAENFRKLVLAMSRDIRVLLVKLADRLHNMRTLHYIAAAERRQRIARETFEIYAPLAERMGMDGIKAELQTLAFAELNPDAYATVVDRLNTVRGIGADAIEACAADLRRACRDAGITVIDVSGREKSPYSIWEKMQRRNMSFDQLSDIMAFRITVPSREDCYAALGAVHAAFPVIAGRFKDYISLPKQNGYRALHTGVTIRATASRKVEVQIRTPDMAEVAEKGVAAHWVYKGDGAGGSPETDRLPWVQDLLDILETSAAADEFLDNTKLELYQDQVFCLTPKSKLITLPRGATPVDFAYAVHSQIGDTCVGAKVNGRLVPLRTQLANGDTVEIHTARGGTPSPEWEKFVVTGKARARIRRFVQAQLKEKSIASGRAELARAFRQDGVDGSEKVLEANLKALRQPSLADLYAAVGSENLAAREVVYVCYPDLRRTARGPRMVPQLPPRAARHTAPSHTRTPISGLLANMAVHYAGCCRPLPGDPISGIVTTGKGVTIHTSDCQTLQNFATTPERLIDVDWDRSVADGAPHVGRVSIMAESRADAMATVANAIARQKGRPVSLKIASKQQDFLEIIADVEVTDVTHLTQVIAGLRVASGIAEAQRARG